MGLIVRGLSGFVLGLAALSTACSRNEHKVHVNDDLPASTASEESQKALNLNETSNNFPFSALELKLKEEKEQVRKWAIEHRYQQTAHNVVSDPTKYIVDEDDIDFIIGKKVILIDNETGVLSFVDDNEANLEAAKTQNKKVIRRDNSSWFNLGIGKNLWTTEIIKTNKAVKDRVQAFLVKNLEESFCLGLAMNFNDYPVDNEIIDVCTENKDRQVSYYFARKPSFKVNDLHRQIVRTDYKSPLARGAVRNPGYVTLGLKDVPQEDKKVCRDHPKSDVAAVLSGLEIYQFEETDMKVAEATLTGLDDIEIDGIVVEDDTSSYAANIVKKLNRPVKQNEIETARNNPGSDFAQITVNKFYLEGRTKEDIQKDIDYAFELAKKSFEKGHIPCPAFSEELFANPNLPLTEDITLAAMSEPFCFVGVAEAIAEREDYPLNEKTLARAKEIPYSPFSKGLETNIAVRDLRKTILLTEDLIKSVDKENISKEVNNLIAVAGSLISNVDKEIEAAKGQAYPASEIISFRQMIEEVKKEIEKQAKLKVIEVTDLNFEKEVLKSVVPVLVDFWAPWCKPCLEIAPVIEEVANDYKGKLKVVKLNIDDNEKTTKEYSIQAIPKVVLFVNGKNVDEALGLVPKEEILKIVDKHVTNK